MRTKQWFLTPFPALDFVNNGLGYPRFRYVDLVGPKLAIDIGLFTDPVYCWPLVRIVVISSIGCAVYAVGHGIHGIVKWGGRLRKVSVMPINQRTVFQELRAEHTGESRDPIVARIIIRVLFVIVASYLAWLLVPPIVTTELLPRRAYAIETDR